MFSRNKSADRHALVNARVEQLNETRSSREDWLDKFSTELARLRPHMGYTGANMIARALFSTSLQEPPLELARLSARELLFMSNVDNRLSASGGRIN